MESFDVKTAFLHSPINEDVWVVPPPGHIFSPGKVWKLNKALYGTKQAGRCWWLHLKTMLEQLGFNANPQDQSIHTYQKDNSVAFLWIRVNDGLLVANLDKLLSRIRAGLSKALTIKWD